MCLKDFFGSQLFVWYDNLINDRQLEDLKQFIDSRISQSEAHLEGMIDDLTAEMSQRFTEIQSAIAETITTNNDSADDHLNDHEQRIVRLQRQRA